MAKVRFGSVVMTSTGKQADDDTRVRFQADLFSLEQRPSTVVGARTDYDLRIWRRRVNVCFWHLADTQTMCLTFGSEQRDEDSPLL